MERAYRNRKRETEDDVSTLTDTHKINKHFIYVLNFLKFTFLDMMSVLSAHICILCMCLVSVKAGSKNLQPITLELQMAVRHRVGAGTRTWVLAKRTSVPNK